MPSLFFSFLLSPHPPPPLRHHLLALLPPSPFSSFFSSSSLSSVASPFSSSSFFYWFSQRTFRFFLISCVTINYHKMICLKCVSDPVPFLYSVSPATPHFTHSESQSSCGGLRGPASSVSSSSLVSSRPAHRSCLVSWLFLQHFPHAQVFSPTRASLRNALPQTFTWFYSSLPSNLFSKPLGEMCKHFFEVNPPFYTLFSPSLLPLSYISYCVYCQLPTRIQAPWGWEFCLIHCCSPEAGCIDGWVDCIDWMKGWRRRRCLFLRPARLRWQRSTLWNKEHRIVNTEECVWEQT